MKNRIFPFRKNQDFNQTNKTLARRVIIGGTIVAFTYSLFVTSFWQNIGFWLYFLPALYIMALLYSFFNSGNVKKLYNIILIIFIITTYVMIYVGYILNYSDRYDILFISIINIMLLVLASRRQFRIYFFSVFPLGIISMFLADVNPNTRWILVVMFLFSIALGFMTTYDRNRLYKKLQSNSNILRALIQSTNESIILVNYFSKKIVDVNEKALKEFGYLNLNELTGKNYTETLFADYTDLETQRINIKKQLNTRGFFETEIELTKKEGTRFWALLTIIPFEAENENFYLLQIRNIEEKKKIEQELRENNFWFHFIMDNLDEFIYVVKYYDDGIQRFEYTSPYIQEIFGISSDDFLSSDIKLKIQERYHPNDVEKIRTMIAVYRKEKIPVEITYRFKPIGSDEYIWILEKTIPKLNDKGEIAYTLGVLRKISPPSDNKA